MSRRYVIWGLIGLASMVVVITVGGVSAANIIANNTGTMAEEPVAAGTAAGERMAKNTAAPAEKALAAPTAIETESMETDTSPAPLTPDETAETTPTDTPNGSRNEPADEGILTGDDRPQRLRSVTGSWNTNWNQHTIDYDELLSGGPPRDGIPSIDEPVFIDPGEAAEWLAGNEPVIALEIDGDARAYPLQIMTWHEIVNDTVAEVPVLVTFCPLCNSAIVFDRRLDGEVYEFGTSGLLRNSDLVMYDRTTESLWQQLTGEAIIGDLTGSRLTFLPTPLVSFDDFRRAFPDGVVLSRETGHQREYGRNPYTGYDTIGNNPFLFDGEQDGRLPAMERVVTVPLEGTDMAYPLSILSEAGIISDNQSGQDMVILHAAGASSALSSATIADGTDVGATGVFDPHLEGRKLSFRLQDGAIVDIETGSTWNVLGQSIDGPLAGKSLRPIVHGDHFWFAWAAFKPNTVVYESGP